MAELPRPVQRPAPIQRPGAAPFRAAERQAKAEAARSSAEANKIREQKELIEAQSRAKQQEHKIQREMAGQTPGERLYRTGVQVGALGIGLAAGAKVAKTIEKRHVTALAASAKQVEQLGGLAAKLMKQKPGRAGSRAAIKAQLIGVVQTAHKMGLTKVRGPIGVVPAGMLLAEGAMARFIVAPQIQNEAARELVGAGATASLFAATTLIGKRLTANRTLAALPPSKGFAAIEAAKARVGLPTPTAGARALGVAGKVMSIGGKVFLPLAVAGAAYESYQGYQRAGVKGAAFGAADSLTFGAASALHRFIKGQNIATAKVDALTLAQRASNRAHFEMKQVRLRAAAGRPTSNGFTQAYYRVQAGRTTRVAGYRTPARGR